MAPNYTFAGHTFVTRNFNQATRHSPLAQVYHTYIPLLLIGTASFFFVNPIQWNSYSRWIKKWVVFRTSMPMLVKTLANGGMKYQILKFVVLTQFWESN